MSWWLSVARWTVLLVTLAPVGPSAAEAQLAQSATGEILSREAFRFPFAARGEWLQFVRGTENGAAAAEHYARAFSEADYARYRDGALTTTTRISYRSGNLAIRGFIVEPKAPGPHPVIIFNHGGVMQWGRIILPEIMEFNRLAERGYIVLASAYRGEGGSEGSPAMDGAVARALRGGYADPAPARGRRPTSDAGRSVAHGSGAPAAAALLSTEALRRRIAHAGGEPA
jgi:hypothetical protein